MRVRQPAVAGTFYPGSEAALRAAIDAAFADAVPATGPPVRALVVPHAGYIYSGPIAASAYRRLDPSVRRVVLLGPSHRVPLRGMAVPSVDGFATPLGVVPIDRLELPVDDLPHAAEHSLEVQLPFLQTVLADFRLLPIAVGWCEPDEVADVLDQVWAKDTAIVVSTDLSHYHPYETAAAIDQRTAAAIASARPSDISDDQACGAYGLRGFLAFAQRRGLAIEQLDLRNSGDTAGDRERVVGYGAFAAAA